MRLCVLAGYILLAGVAALAEEGNVVNGGVKTEEPSVAKAFPEEYTTYEKAQAENNGTNPVHAALVLLAKAKEALRGANTTTNETQEQINVCRGAWRLCIRAMQKSKDQPSRCLVVDEWNRSLREDDAAVPSQIYALSGQWDRDLLGEDFWALLRGTSQKKTISAISYVLYEHGNTADAKRLMQKRTSGIRPSRAEQGHALIIGPSRVGPSRVTP